MQRSALAEPQSYDLTVVAGQYFHVRFNFYGVDAAVHLIAPDGSLVEKLFSPNRNYGRMRFMLVARQSGSYRFEVRSLEPAGLQQENNRAQQAEPRRYYGEDFGRYSVTLVEQRPALPADQARGLAERAFLQGWRLRSEETLPSVRQAMEKFAEALPHWQASGDRFDEAYTLTFLGEAHQQLSEYRLAMQTFEEALKVWRAIGDSMGEPWTLSNLGGAYEATGDRERALHYYQQALDIYSSTGDARGKGICLTAIGGIYAAWADKQKALDSLRRALPNWMAENVTDSLGEAQAMNRIGAVLASLGDSITAVRFHQRALKRSVDYASHTIQSASLHHLARAYAAANKPSEALDCVRQAREIQQRVGDRRGLAASLLLLGGIHHDAGRLHQALAHQQEALQLSIDIGDRSGEALARRSLGATLALAGERIRAEKEFRSALALHRQTGDREGEAATLYYWAKLEYEIGDFHQALDHIRGAVEIVEGIRIRVASPELRSLFLAAVQEYFELYRDVLMQLHRLQPTAGHAEAAFRVNERAKARSLVEALDEAGVESRQSVQSDLRDRERWLQQQINEKAHARSQLEQSGTRGSELATINERLQDLTLQYREVQEVLRTADSQWERRAQVQPVSVETLQRQLLDADTLLLEYGLGEDRSYLWAVTPTSLSSHELPGRHQIEQVATQFCELLFETPLMGGVAAPAATVGQSQSPQRTPAQRNHQSLSNSEIEHSDSKGAGGSTDLGALGMSLSKMLLGPVASQLQGKRLVIIADGILQYVPFAALPAPGGFNRTRTSAVGSRTRRPTTAIPLITSNEIVHLPSASALVPLRLFRKNATARKAVAVLADPVFESDDPRVRKKSNGHRSHSSVVPSRPAIGGPSAVHDETAHDGLPELHRTLEEATFSDSPTKMSRLVFSRQEANAILALARPADSKKALDFAASRSLAVSGELGQYRIVHFATHGLLDRANPGLSGIVLSLFNDQGQPQDGFLRLHDIYRLEIQADLVVLSACKTALGKNIRGEGLVGLARGFMVAGAARVVASLWKVDDRATAELMSYFYSGVLRRGLTPAAALRSAQLELWQQGRWKHPRYWAAFQIQGEWR